MIYIDSKNTQPPEKWRRRAKRFTNKLKAIESNEDKKVYIKKHGYFWAEIKKWLLDLSYGKCWYSEAKDCVSYYNIDHFRPKSEAKNLDETKREGYWWLAFDWTNYRIAGSICNCTNNLNGETFGKGTFFPLRDGSISATHEDNNIDQEVIYLLDPRNPRDPSILTFDDEGCTKPATELGAWEIERAEVTIKLYYLNYELLIDERKKILIKCNFLVNIGQYLLKPGATVSDPIRILYESLTGIREENLTKEIAFKEIYKVLDKMTSPQSEFSSAASACLLGTGIPWARDIVLKKELHL